MTIDVFAICYNEQFLLPHFIKHYQSIGANITIYDNFSTDNSKEIIIDAGCNYKTFFTNGQIRDDIYLAIKNECWKVSKADWVIVCDIDELLELPPITPDNIKYYFAPYNIIRTQGYDMIGTPHARLGVKNNMYSKAVMFRPDALHNIGYQPGCHTFGPQPKKNLTVSPWTAPLLHYKYISEEYLYQRHLMYQSRLSDFNEKYGYGIEYANVEKEKINKKFEELNKEAIIVPSVGVEPTKY